MRTNGMGMHKLPFFITKSWVVCIEKIMCYFNNNNNNKNINTELKFNIHNSDINFKYT